MKRLFTLIALCFCAVNLYAQNRVYCEIVERKSFGKKVKVIVDFGQKRQKNNAAQTLVDKNGDMVIFNSKIDALNYLDSLGWNFLQAYTEVNGSDGDASSQIHWLLYKEITDNEDPYKGLITKEMSDKGI